MADTVTGPTILQQNDKRVTIKIVVQSDGTGTSGTLKFQAKFSSEGLDVFVPGNGIRFETGVYLDLTTTDSVTIGYTG